MIDFSNTTIIATSNLGSAVIMENAGLPEAEQKTPKALHEELMQLLKGHFRPEFLNRILVYSFVYLAWIRSLQYHLSTLPQCWW